MRKRKILGVVAAALLAVTPVTTTGITLIGHSNVVSAATEIKLSSKKPYLRLAPGSSFDSFTIVKDIKSNVGTVDYVENIDVYKKASNGDVKWGYPVHEEQLKPGTEGVIVVTVDVHDLKNGSYTYMTKTDAGDIVPTTEDDMYYTRDAAIEIPFVVGSKKSNLVSTKRSSRTAVITGRYNNKVRTYTSRGKFAHHYVYSGHSYKFNVRRVIKGKTYFKLYGKRQYVRADKLKF
ncbi:hypothetical protein ODV15_06190 [Lactobacillus amylovorus]|uniref:Surface layer protein A domain-containing protein n=1 Tax=Lactobacillus amylovorus TaxID=1604 RepID=A0A9X3W8M0_LACAM|nr:hypothetical protein [Lactobacillus amylovorus]MDB6262150.1 hypothetical protein [Lactobacillus amylovorus]